MYKLTLIGLLLVGSANPQNKKEDTAKIKAESEFYKNGFIVNSDILLHRYKQSIDSSLRKDSIK